MMINFDKRHRAFWQGKTQLTSDIDFDVDDSSWHEVIIYIRHSTDNGYDGVVRMWWDGQEVVWSYTGDYSSNTALNFGSGSTWTKWMAFGFQSRPAWGEGNITYFDNIVVASEQSDVIGFLRDGGSIVIDDDDNDPADEQTTIGSPENLRIVRTSEKKIYPNPACPSTRLLRCSDPSICLIFPARNALHSNRNPAQYWDTYLFPRS
jgi:hypothetical protein